MNTEHINQYIQDLEQGDNLVIPFSNGSEAIDWDFMNCSTCVKSWANNYGSDDFCPSADETEEACKTGQECIGKYALDLSHMTGSLPFSIAQWIGATRYDIQKNGCFTDLPNKCLNWSDKDDDRYNFDDPVLPEDPNQLMIPFSVFELFGFDDPQVLVTKKAIFELQN